MPRIFLPLILLGLLLPSGLAAQTRFAALEADDLQWLGTQIFTNECNRQLDCLLSWNRGEDFPSLGIGHFIWYREGQQEPFEESFPALLNFLQQQGHTLPGWLETVRFEQPWPDRDSFLAARQDEQLQALARLLETSMADQTAFILERFRVSLDRLLGPLPTATRSALEAHMDAMLRQDARLGAYALIDYVHFKGDGSKPAERYQGTGWGLLQVLQGMENYQPQAALQAFAASAATVLERRVTLAPPERDEQRWLAGWHKRLQTYVPATTSAGSQ